MLELVGCYHEAEDVLWVGAEFETATCKQCGQVRQYKPGDKHTEVITHLGRINGSIVLPPAGTRFAITPEESRLVAEGYQLINDGVGRKAPAGYGKRKETHEPEPESSPIAVSTDESTEEVRFVIQEEKPPKESKYLDENREEILADRVSIGHGKALEKWNISTNVWVYTARRWKMAGYDIPDLRNRDNAKFRGTAPDQRTTESEHSSESGIDWKLKYESYRQAVLDIFGNKGQN